jgi:thiol:disulfide interchange protein DsbA
VRAGADAGPRPRRLVSAVGLAAAAAILLLVAGLVLRQPDPVGEGRQLAVPATARNAVASLAPGLAGDTPIREPAVPGLVAGIQYERLPVPAPTSVLAGRIEVDEFFMFGCGHCFAFEPQFVAWSEAQPANVEIVRVPALFNATARLHARAFYTAEALGVLDALIEPFYAAIHVRGNALATEADLREFFARLGIAGDRFDAAFGSAVVAARLAEAERLNRAYRVDATPSIGVNGKYLTNAAMVGSTEALLETVDALVEFESGAQCRSADPSRCPVSGRPLLTPTPTPDRDLFR